jgi:peptide/nickel transport system ATP-binding protein
MSAVIELRGVAQRYGDRVVLAPSDLVVEAGEVVGICGPSGAGKSTLLRILAGLEPPDEGQVLFSGVPVWRHRLGRWVRDVPRPGYVMPVFQHARASLDPRWPLWRTVTEPLTVSPGAVRSGAERRQRTRALLAEVGLEHLNIEAVPGELSIGQCQRLAILRALAAGPAVIAADEPTSALDTTTAAAVLRLLRSVADAGTALLIASHDQAMLSVMADRIIRVEDGLLPDDSPQALNPVQGVGAGVR